MSLVERLIERLPDAVVCRCYRPLAAVSALFDGDWRTAASRLVGACGRAVVRLRLRLVQDCAEREKAKT